jgi:hypothetical protein
MSDCTPNDKRVEYQGYMFWWDTGYNWGMEMENVTISKPTILRGTANIDSDM